MKIYIDAGVSGKSTDRAEYRRMLAAVDAGEVRRIVATKLDRLSRNTRDFLELLDYCDQRACGVVSIAESFDTSTDVGRAVVSVLMVFAELERKQIATRMRTGKTQKASEGGYNGAPAPYGYTYAGGQWDIDTDQAATVRRVFADFLDGQSLSAIARDLAAADTPTARNGSWASATMRYLITNGAYAGKAQWDGVERDEGEYPAIVSVEDYEAAQQRLAVLKPGNPTFGKQRAF